MRNRLLQDTVAIVVGWLLLYAVRAVSLRPQGVGFARLDLLALGLPVSALLIFMITTKYSSRYRVLSLCFAIPTLIYSSFWLARGAFLFAVYVATYGVLIFLFGWLGGCMGRWFSATRDGRPARESWQ